MSFGMIDLHDRCCDDYDFINSIFFRKLDEQEKKKTKLIRIKLEDEKDSQRDDIIAIKDDLIDIYSSCKKFNHKKLIELEQKIKNRLNN
jgi:hypothetical protein